ncbi:MAG: hypothetical protein PHG71_08580, partial [Kiritimatiellae bacterium]|nr:hypothetical protein [Kiritimatiellia bacterium]
GQVYAEQGALKVAWDTRSARKTADGSPRFTRLTTGRATHRAKRVYGGTGAVWEDLDRLKLLQSGFALSTRHVGFEFTNGLALVEATDVPCDYLEVDTSNRIARLVTHNDAVFAFVPSSRGAFDAARRFAKVSGYKTSPGFKAMLGKTCIDDWSREYLNQAAALRMSKKYGLDHVLYLQHNWQRWGYDARLPEVYPPKGDIAAFDEMARTANGLGYRFGIHDNYVDYYPDAAGFSYDLICFKEDGTPLEAWYNPGPRSLSYRWLAHAIHPTLKRNQELLKKHHPTALFLDVFTASNLKDYYDRNGVFYPKSRNVVEWRKAWNESREAYGVTDAIMVSEAGSDSQIGAIDAGQCDHFTPDYLAEKSVFSEGERVPWHDTVSHGKMHLFGGGLGFRYSRAKPADQTGDNGLHGYGTDDYFCTTLIGGRTPMAPSFSRLTVNTYWMLNGICAELAGSDFLDFEFADGLHRQHASFGGGEVWINRDTKRGLWKLGGKLLPVYGFYAKTRGGKEAGVVSLDGQRAGFARKPGLFYVDARPLAGKGEVSGISSRALSADCSKPDTVAVKTQWDLSGPIAPQFVPFTHVVPLGGTDIRMHGHGVKWTPDEKATVGRYEKDVVVTVSKDVPDGEYAILYGMFDPQGPRLSIRGMCDDERRVYGGVITVSHAADGRRELAWRAGGVTGRDRDLEFNVERKMLDFGGIRTDGAFRFKHPEMVLTPLPASGPLRAEIDLSKFGAAGRRLAAVEAVEPMKYADVPVWRQEGERVMLELDCAAFAYQLQFAE